MNTATKRSDSLHPKAIAISFGAVVCLLLVLVVAMKMQDSSKFKRDRERAASANMFHEAMASQEIQAPKQR